MSSWLLLPISLLLVTAGAEALVRGASLLALRLGVSPLVIGLTIVGFGTSSPELAASLVATLRGSTDVSVGNVVGSNIFNVAVIVGVTAVIRPVHIPLRAIRRDLALATAAAFVPWLALAFGGEIPRAAGGALVAVLVGYLIASYRVGRHDGAADAASARVEVLDAVAPRRAARPGGRGVVQNLGLVALGLALLVEGSRLFVISALDVARALGASELVIGLTVVAAGTSLPELVTSLVAAYRRNTEIAVGNIIGSNIFNVFGILGVCALVRPQELPAHVLRMDAPVMLLATLVLVPIIRSGDVISRREGVLLLTGYGLYLASLIARGG